MKSGKSFDNKSMNSGKMSNKGSVNFNMMKTANVPAGNDTLKSEKNYGIPTLKMLNPELYKEIEKQEK